ncbi:hypothetical protein N2152v2_007195 [Parachlorella kessleri]
MQCPQHGEFLELFVPGRLCLFGEHSDWAGSYRKLNKDLRPGQTIVVGTQAGLSARVRRLERPVLVVRSTKNDGSVELSELPMDADILAEEAAAGGFFSYAAGVAYKMLVDFGVGGLEVDNYQTSLPLKKGLSSSAAFCVLMARAFNRSYNLRLTTRGEMEYAYQGERLTPSQCGKMDQGCAFGQVPVLMTYNGDLLGVRPACLGAPLHLVLVDLRASKNTVLILRSLQEAFPHPVGPQQQAAVELFGPINELLVGRALQAMEAGDVEHVGRLMRKAQHEFDLRAAPLCPSELTSPVLHRVLEYPPIQEHIFGGKGVGSQGDGTAQLLCRDADGQAAVCSILTQELGLDCMAFTVPATAAAANGAVEATANGAAEHQLTEPAFAAAAAAALAAAAEREGQQPAAVAVHRALDSAKDLEDKKEARKVQAQMQQA